MNRSHSLPCPPFNARARFCASIATRLSTSCISGDEAKWQLPVWLAPEDGPPARLALLVGCDETAKGLGGSEPLLEDGVGS